MKEYMRMKNIQQREFWPLVVAGVAIAVGSTIINYTARAVQRMKAENDDSSPKAADESYSSDETSKKSSIIVEHSIGIDIGSSNSRVSLKLGNESPKVIENNQGLR